MTTQPNRVRKQTARREIRRRPLQRDDHSACERLDDELCSMARWAYYGIVDSFMRALMFDWENRGENDSGR